MTTSRAFMLGFQAHNTGLGYNTNPYSPEDESDNFNAWFEGWGVADLSDCILKMK